MDRFPLMIYRAPGRELIDGVLCETRIVHDDDELDAAQDDGWQPTVAAAGEALKADKARADADASDEARALAQAEADLAAAAIRAPLEAEIEQLRELLNAAAEDFSNEKVAHDATRALLDAERAKAAAPAKAKAKG